MEMPKYLNLYIEFLFPLPLLAMDLECLCMHLHC